MLNNPYIAQFLEQAHERFSIDAANMSMSEWVCKNTTLRNRPFSLKGYEFQEKILDDMHPNLSVIKISQVGMTEIQIRKALAFLVRNNGTSLIFTLPNEDMFKRVSNPRIKPIVNKDKVFNTPQDKENKATRSVDMMQFGQSFLYVVAALESAATSIPADAIFNDEIDLSDQKIISLFNSRLQNSKFKISQRFSTPTFPSYGVDLDWQSSDQQMYLCKCDSCGHWNHPEFNHDFIHLEGAPEQDGARVKLTDITEAYIDQINLDTAFVKCEKCGSPLDLGNPDNREWVGNFPSRTNSRGYRIGTFSTDKITIPYIFKQLWDYQRKEYVRGFHNTVLGVPYSDGTIQIPREDIIQCMEAGTPNKIEVGAFEDMWIGIDMGQICHVTLGRGNTEQNLEVVSIYEVHVDDIVQHAKKLCEEMPIRFGTVDRHPYEPTSREIFRETGGKILPVEYRGNKDINIVYDEYDPEEVKHGQVNHTWFLDNLATKIRKHELTISGYGHRKEVFIEHLRDMVRDEKPDEPAHWMKLNGNDHYFHSTAFMCAAIKIAELINIKSKADKRTMALAVSADMSKNTQNLIGMASNKKVEKITHSV